MRRRAWFGVVMVAGVGLAGSMAVGATSVGQSQAIQAPPQPIAWSLSVEPAGAAVKAGETLKAVVTAKIGEGWHVYAPDEANSGPRPVRITVPTNAIFAEAGTLDAPEPQREMDEAFGEITASYTGETLFRLPVKAAADAPAGAHTLKIEITFQACDGRMCLPPKVVKLETPVTVAGQ